MSTLAPSSYHNKRARLSGPSPAPTPSNAQNTGTYSSRTSSRLARAPSSTRSGPGGTNTGTGAGTGPPESASERERRRSVSQRSIPISALVTPHAPSIGRSSAYHMRDPRRPPRRMETGWALRFRTQEEEGSPVHAWMFYIAFVLFPLWWVAAFWRVPQTRVVGGTDTEKAVPLDDPQIEFGTFSLAHALFVCVLAQRNVIIQMRGLGASDVASWRVSRCSHTSRLSSASRSSREIMPTIMFFSPRTSVITDVLLLAPWARGL